LSGKNTFSIVQKTATNIVQNGIKDVFEITTKSGKRIKATHNHPLYTISGWNLVENLKVGVRIATPRKIQTKSSQKIDTRKAAALGYLLAEGNLCHPHGIYFYSTQENEILDFISCTSSFENIKCTIDRKKKTISVYCSQINQREGNQLCNWIKEIGLTNKKATEKNIPQEVFEWDTATEAVFLGKLWQGGGCISIKNSQIYYATRSYKLASDVAHLLLRFGIISTIHTKKFKYRGGIKIGYTIIVTHGDNLSTFSRHIGTHLIGKKKENLDKLLEKTDHTTSVEARGTKDTIPKEILSIIRSEMKKENISVDAIAKKTKISLRLFSEDTKKIGYTRDVVGILAEALDSEILRSYAYSDIYWDEIVSIKKRKPEMTYDLTVSPHSNFVANDIIVHNSHAASYGKVAYQTAYMKANFPAIYMSAVLTAESGDVDMIAEIIAECKRMKIPVLPPDINESFEGFTVVTSTHNAQNTNIEHKDSIRFGLTTIKNFGEGIGGAIISERKKNGKFKSLSDFLRRVHDKNLNKKSLESLIKAGALDSFNPSDKEYRGTLLHNLERLLTFHKEERQSETAQDSLFSLMATPAEANEISLEPAPAGMSTNQLMWEKELLGLYISGHPLDSFAEKISKLTPIHTLKETAKEKQPVVIAGIIEEIRDVMTKKGEKMIFLKLADFTDSIDAVVFPKIFEEFQDVLIPESCIVIKGSFSLRNGEKSVLIDKVKVME